MNTAKNVMKKSTQKGFDMKKVFRALRNIFALLIGADCDWKREAVDNGLCDFSGEGRDKNGR